LCYIKKKKSGKLAASINLYQPSVARATDS
jgi:hypothetical protein